MKFRWWMIPVTLITFSLGLFGYAAWTTYGHAPAIHDHQADLSAQLQLSLGEQIGNVGASGLVKAPKALPGQALARITIPSLKLEWIVVEGTAPGDIAQAPGHYSFSAMPGQKGNFAVAGHRSPGLFWDLDKVKPGTVIMVESRKGTFTYVVTRNFITAPDSWAEVSTTPPGFRTGNKVLTLTTCNPKWDNYQRLVIHAVIQA